jgi:hypothetical protein
MASGGDDRNDEARTTSRRRGLPRMSDLLDVTDEMIAFADRYQQVWEHEARATLALGEFLSARSASLRAQVELMRMGNEAFRRYSAWSESLFGVRPETFMQGLMDQMERWRPQRSEDTK